MKCNLFVSLLFAVVISGCGGGGDLVEGTVTTGPPSQFFKECFLTSNNQLFCFNVGKCGVVEDYCAGRGCMTVQRTCEACPTVGQLC